MGRRTFRPPPTDTDHMTRKTTATLVPVVKIEHPAVRRGGRRHGPSRPCRPLRRGFASVSSFPFSQAVPLKIYHSHSLLWKMYARVKQLFPIIFVPHQPCCHPPPRNRRRGPHCASTSRQPPLARESPRPCGRRLHARRRRRGGRRRDAPGGGIGSSRATRPHRCRTWCKRGHAPFRPRRNRRHGLRDAELPSASASGTSGSLSIVSCRRNDVTS